MRIAVAVAVVVAACSSSVSTPPASRPQPTSTPDLPERAERADSVTRYCDSLLVPDDFPTIASKLPLDLRGDHVTPEMLTIAAIASDDEKREVLVLVTRHAQCHAKETEVVGSLSGPPSIWYVHERQRHLDLLERLYSGALTYAQFNQSLKDSDAVSERERVVEETERYSIPPEQLASLADERARQAAEVQRAYEQFVSTASAPAPPAGSAAPAPPAGSAAP
jgi:hypothetical protein